MCINTHYMCTNIFVVSVVTDYDDDDGDYYYYYYYAQNLVETSYLKIVINKNKMNFFKQHLIHSIFVITLFPMLVAIICGRPH